MNYERKLRQQLRAFLTSRGPHRAILSTLLEWEKREWRPFLFGGLLRDILILGLRQGPRDVDVVITNVTSEQLAEALHPYIKRQTRFGGFQLELHRWHFDVWPLHKTWAFNQNRALTASPENLPKTTFLNVEAVAVSLDEHGEVGEIFEAGFFDALRTRIVDINLEQNPYPELAAVRALATAAKLRYSLSTRLGRYIVETEKMVGPEALVAIQDSHYGFVRFRKQAIRLLVDHITRELDRSPETPIRLPEARIRQLSLW